MAGDKVPVSYEVMLGLNFVKANEHMWHNVVRAANYARTGGYWETARWIEENPLLYVDAMLVGYKVRKDV